MKHNQMNTNYLESLVDSVFQTIWAIGTSITASAVLITFNMSMNFIFKVNKLTPNGYRQPL